MNEIPEIPIFNKIYDFYKTLYKLRNTLPKQDRYTLWQQTENITLEIMENILSASTAPKSKKPAILEKTSDRLNKLRVFVRLSKDLKAIDQKKYIALQENIDEMGKMLGGWIKSTKIS